MRIKKLGQTFTLLLAVCMVLAGLPGQVYAGMMDMTNFNDGRIEVSKVPRGKAGDKITIRMKIVNDQDYDMEDTTITLVGGQRYDDILNNVFEEEEDDTEEDENTIRNYNTQFPFEADSSTFEDKKVGTIRKNSSKTVSMTFQLRRDLPAGYYQAFFDLNSSRDHEKTVGVNLWVSASDGTEEETEEMDYDITIGENQSTPFGAYGEVLNFGVNLRNSGHRKMYDVRVYMQLDAAVEKFPFDINDGNYDRQMGNMNPDQTVAVPFSMAVREKAKSGYYPIKFKIRYRENENGNFAAPVEDTFYVRVYGKDEADSLDSEAGENERTKARIIVDSFETDPAEIYAGQDFTLKVRMKNASNSIAASNILFTFESEAVSDSPVFTTVNGSNSVVVNSLAPGASDTLTIKFSSSPTAEQRSYTITINEQYDSPEFKNAKEAVKIAVGLKQEARLNTGTIEVMPDAISVGEESNVMFSINNTGKVMLYNVNAVFEADSIQKNEAYVGNIEPGKSGNVDTMINGIAPTTDDGKVKLSITYEDENGKVSTVEKEIQLMVNEDQSMDESNVDDTWSSDDIQPEPSTTDKLKHLAIPVGIVGVVLAAVILVVIRRKKKKAGMDDEIL